MELDRSIPRSIDYQDVLPVAVPAVARRRRFFPANGTTFSFGGSNEIRIEISSVNSMLDPLHSYLELTVVNRSATTFGMDIGGTHCLFEEVRLEQGGRVLAREQNHNRLNAAILSACQTSTDGRATDSITEFQKGYNNFGAVNRTAPAPLAGSTGIMLTNDQHNSDADLAAGQRMRLTMKMPTGLFTQNKLIPLPLVAQNSPITLVFRLANPERVGVWAAQPADTDLEVIRISYVGQLIEVGGDVIQQVRMIQDMSGGQLTISGQDFEYLSGTIPNGTAGQLPIRLPCRKRSMKSLFFQINSEDFGNGAAGLAMWNAFNLSFGGNANMDDYQLKVGSVVYPPQPVACWGNCARAAVATRPIPVAERGECVMELAKAFGSLGFTNPTGHLCTTMYGTNGIAGVAAGNPELADGDNGDGGGIPATTCTTSGDTLSVCPFGLSLESFQHTAIESGVDSETMALELNLIINVPAVGSGLEDKTLHAWILHDRHYYVNRDGSITTSD